MLSCKVKASQVTNLTDARYYAAWEVDWIGFCLDPQHEGALDRNQFHAMREWIEGPKIVAEFHSMPVQAIQDILPDLSVDGIQLGPFYTPSDFETFEGIERIKSIIIDPEMTLSDLEDLLEAHHHVVDIFLIDFSKNGFSWDQLEDHPEFDANSLLGLCSQYPILLSMDLDPKQLEAMLRTTKAYGIHLYGEEEEAVGVKSFEEIDELIEVLYVEG